ncbi:MAG: serine/threonine protein kinase [Planctomycetota bacterium]|jgi:serine/threonine-protein kinase
MVLSRIKAWFGSSGDKSLERMSDYRVFDVVGTGAMSVVKRATHKKTFRSVAIKILSPESRRIITKIESQYRSMTEGQVGLLFNHPGIIRAYGWGRDGKREFIVMEYFDGVLLRDLLHEGKFNPKQNRMEMLCQMTSALEHIHSRGVVHRDFCPRNVLINDEGQLKVFDFGLSVEIELVKQMRGNRTGTLAYMAPELIKRQQTDQRCDIYALGITMYEVFAGQRPYIGIDNFARLMQVMTAVPEPPSKFNKDISPKLERIILKAIEKDPKNRYATVGELIRDFEPIAEAERDKWNVSPPTPDTSLLRPEDISA